jgi:hypothetical protein
MSSRAGGKGPHVVVDHTDDARPDSGAARKGVSSENPAENPAGNRPSQLKAAGKSAEQIRADILEAAATAGRDAREFNRLLVRPDPRIRKDERAIHMGMVWHFFAEYRRKMTLLKGPAAARDVGKLHAELVSEQQQLQKLGADAAELLCQFSLRRAVLIDECDPHGAA